MKAGSGDSGTDICTRPRGVLFRAGVLLADSSITAFPFSVVKGLKEVMSLCVSLLSLEQDRGEVNTLHANACFSVRGEFQPFLDYYGLSWRLLRYNGQNVKDPSHKQERFDLEDLKH